MTGVGHMVISRIVTTLASLKLSSVDLQPQTPNMLGNYWKLFDQIVQQHIQGRIQLERSTGTAASSALQTTLHFTFPKKISLLEDQVLSFKISTIYEINS